MSASVEALVAEVDINVKEIKEILERLRATLGEADYLLLCKLLDSYSYLTDLVADKRTTIERLRRILFGAPTEKLENVVPPPKEEVTG
jgi:hypothetical protein